MHLTWSHFFDVFVVISEKGLANNTERSVELLFKLLGWKFAEEGDKAGTFSETFTALGVEVQLQQAPMGQVEFANTPKRKAELIDTIATHIQTGKMSVVEAQKLRGRMQFMEGQIFGRLGRLCMRAITEHAFIHKSMTLSEVTLEALRRFLVFLEHSKPRKVHLCSGDSWYVFTDACFEPGNDKWTCGLGGVLIEPSGKPAAFFSCCLSQAQMQCLGVSTKKTIIFEAELLALVLAFALWRYKLEGIPVVCFVDNNSARDVAISGTGRNATARALIGFLLKLEMAACTAPWYARVPTPSNVADEPSRGCNGPLEAKGIPRSDPTVELQQVLEALDEATVKVG